MTTSDDPSRRLDRGLDPPRSNPVPAEATGQPDWSALVHAGAPDPRTRILALALALAADSRFTELRELYAQAANTGIAPEQLAEGALTAHLFCGFPRAIEAFFVLADVVPGARAVVDPRPAATVADAGSALFDRIYDRQADAVRDQLRRFGPDFETMVIGDAYGRILSREGLPASTRELMAICALATLGLDRQLFSHLRGAIACGASRIDAAAMIDLAVAIAPNRAESARATLARALPGGSS